MTLCTSAADLSALRSKWLSAPIFGFDTESCGPSIQYKPKGAKGKPKDAPNMVEHRMVGYSVAVSEGSAYYVPLRHKQPPNADVDVALQLLRDAFARPDATAVMHYAPYDLSMLWHEGIDPKCAIRCTKVLAWMMGKAVPSNKGPVTSLKPLVQHHYGYKMITFGDVSLGRSFEDVSPELAAPYASDDAKWTLRMYLDWYVEQPQAVRRAA